MNVDIFHRENQYIIGARYLNAVDGELVRKWQIFQAEDVTDLEWAYRVGNDWANIAYSIE